MVAERLRSATESEPFSTESTSVNVTVSIGVAISCRETPEELLDRADAQLYRAKQAGRNCICG